MLRVGTDCSGIEAPIQAMEKICKDYNLKYDHIFSSENCQYAIDCIHENYSPRILYGDIQKRNVKDIPDIDMYISTTNANGDARLKVSSNKFVKKEENFFVKQQYLQLLILLYSFLYFLTYMYSSKNQNFLCSCHKMVSYIFDIFLNFGA